MYDTVKGSDWLGMSLCKVEKCVLVAKYHEMQVFNLDEMICPQIIGCSGMLSSVYMLSCLRTHTWPCSML